MCPIFQNLISGFFFWNVEFGDSTHLLCYIQFKAILSCFHMRNGMENKIVESYETT